MRRRIFVAIAGVAIAAMFIHGVSRAVMIASMVRDQEQRDLARAADLLAVVVENRLADGRAIDGADLGGLVPEDEQLDLDLADGRSIRVGSIDAGGGPIATSRVLRDGTVLELRRSGGFVRDRIVDALVPLLVMGALVVSIALVLAHLLSRRLSAPFAALADHADALGSGDDHVAPRSTIAEADRVADALDRSQVRITTLLQREREFSSNASHQLRTPLAAMRLRVEDLSMWPELEPSMKVELLATLDEIDRLADTVTRLLELARSGGIGASAAVPVHEVVDAAMQRWSAPFAAAGRQLVAAAIGRRVVTSTSARSIDLVLDVLLENALVHGSGVVDVTIEAREDHGALRVADEGRLDRTIAAVAFERSVRSASSQGSGIGLALAKTIAEAAGARLHLASSDPTVFELTLATA